MALTDLLPTLQNLPRTEKWRVVEFLVLELAKEEGMPLKAGVEYPLWSPYDSFEAASTLLDALRIEESHA